MSLRETKRHLLTQQHCEELSQLESTFPPPFLPSLSFPRSHQSEGRKEELKRGRASQPRLIAHAHKTFSLLRRRDVGGTRLISFCRTAARARGNRCRHRRRYWGEDGRGGASGRARAARRNDLRWLDKHLNNTFEASGQGVRVRQRKSA